MPRPLKYYFNQVLGRINALFLKSTTKVEGGKGLIVEKGVTISKVGRGNHRLLLGEKVVLHERVGLFFETPKAVIEIGKNTFINRRSEIRCKEHISIGSNCAVSWDVTIMDTDYHVLNNNTFTKPTTIEDNVWIGCKSTIMKGVKIGKGAVIAAGSVVNKDVPAGVLVGGVPARILKENITWK